jgi:hypothetical protein
MTTELVEDFLESDKQLPNLQVGSDNINKTKSTILYVPLKFWFNKKDGLALPPAAMCIMNNQLFKFKKNELLKLKK